MSELLPQIVCLADIPPASPEDIADRERTYRRGYVHGAIAALEYIERGIKVEHLDEWIDALTHWRYRQNPEAEIQPPTYSHVGNQCFYCGDRSGPFHREHVIPKSRGGPDLDINVVCSCIACNFNKGTKTPAEWLGPTCSPRIKERETQIVTKMKTIANSFRL